MVGSIVLRLTSNSPACIRRDETGVTATDDQASLRFTLVRVKAPRNPLCAIGCSIAQTSVPLWPTLIVELAAERRHCVDECGERAVGGGQVGVGQLGQRTPGVFGERREEPTCDVDAVIGDP